MAMPLPASAPVKVPVNCVYCEDEPSSLFMAGEEALPMLDLEPEENWLRCECAAAPSAAGHGCLVGVELTALCRALGGRRRGFGALTHGPPPAWPGGSVGALLARRILGRTFGSGACAAPAVPPRCSPPSTCSTAPSSDTSTNANPKPFIWTKDPNKIIAAVKRGHQALDSIH